MYDVYRTSAAYYNTTGLQCVRFSQHWSSTDLHAVACNLGKLNAGAKLKFVHLIIQQYTYARVQVHMRLLCRI